MNALHPVIAAARRRERGVVLVVSLLLLLVLTVIGLAATRTTTLEQRMTANQGDTQAAFQGAEAALRNGESLLNGAGLPDFSANTAGGYNADTWTGSWQTIDWNDTSAVLTYEGGLNTATQARYFVVLTSQTTTTPGSSLSADAPLVSKVVYYIYARSTGLTSNTAVVLESAYLR